MPVHDTTAAAAAELACHYFLISNEPGAWN